MGKLIIITGPQGCGKSTFASKNYPDAEIFDYYESKQLKEIKKSIKENETTVVCCMPIDCKDLIPKDTDSQYKIITLNSKGEVAQICGRGIFTNGVADGAKEEELKITDVKIDLRPLNNAAITLIKCIFEEKGHRVRYIRSAYSMKDDFIMAACRNPDRKKLISFVKFMKLFNKNPSLTDQLSFHRSEAERIEKLIEEENKPKVGDWVKDNQGAFYKKTLS